MHATHNQFILDTYQKYKSFIYLFSQTVINKRRPGLIEEHRAIVDALFNRDIELAVSLLEDHLKKDLEFSLYYLDFKNQNKYNGSTHISMMWCYFIAINNRCCILYKTIVYYMYQVYFLYQKCFVFLQ